MPSGGINRRRLNTSRLGLIIEPPAISGVSVSALTTTSATIVWVTDQPTNSLVNFGTTSAYGSSSTLADDPPSTNGVTSHSVTLTGLTAGTTYHFQVVSFNAGGESSRTADASFLTPSGMTFFAIQPGPNYHTIGLMWPFSGDDTKTSSCPYVRLTTTALASAGATTIAIQALPCSFPSGTRFVFFNGVVAVLSAPAALGATSLSVAALPSSIPSGTRVWVSGLLFKQSAATEWRMGIAADRTDYGGTDPGDGSQRAYVGKLLKLISGTSYDAQIRVVRSGSEFLGTTTVLTRSDTFSPPATLLAGATYFVDPVNGADANNGLSRAGAWRTINKAFTTAPSGVTVELEPGHLIAPVAQRTTPISLVARYSSVIDDNSRATEPDLTRHSIIYSGFQSAPTGTVPDPVNEYKVAPWTTYTNPNGRTCWRWSPGPASTIDQAGWSSTREGEPQRIPLWATSGAATADAWLDMLFTHIGSNHGTAEGPTPWGWYLSGSDIYLVMPLNAANSNPNNLWITLGPKTSGASGELLKINAPNSRVCGVRFDCGTNTLRVGSTAIGAVNCDNTLIDHCMFVACKAGIALTGADPTTYVLSGNSLTNTTIQYCRFKDSNLFNLADVSHTISWYKIKQNVQRADGTLTTNRVLSASESGPTAGKNWFSNLVIRYCTTDGCFNGFGLSSLDAPDTPLAKPWRREYSQWTDVHDCVIRNCEDPCEPEECAMGHAYWRLRLEHTYTNISLGPGFIGPLYAFDCESWDGSGLGNVGTAQTDTHVGYKFSGSGTTNPVRVYHYNNMWWSDAGGADTTRARGSGQFAGGGANTPTWYVANSGIRATDKDFETAAPAKWNEDFNLFGGTGRGFDLGGVFYTAVASYRTASGQGASTNVVGGADLDLLTGGAARFLVDLTDPPNGDLTRKAGAAANTAGMPLPNLWDLATPETTWAGAAPPLGPAVQTTVSVSAADVGTLGETAVTPQRTVSDVESGVLASTATVSTAISAPPDVGVLAETVAIDTGQRAAAEAAALAEAASIFQTPPPPDPVILGNPPVLVGTARNQS